MTYVIDAKTPRGAAGQLKRAIQAEITATYGRDDPAVLEITVEARGLSYTVTWIEGPYEWAIVGTMGGDIWAEELTGELSSADPTFAYRPSGRWVAEAETNYSVGFYPAS
jgi:hypothetical protein